MTLKPGDLCLVAKTNGQISIANVVSVGTDYIAVKQHCLKRPTRVRRNSKTTELFTKMDEAIAWIKSQRGMNQEEQK